MIINENVQCWHALHTAPKLERKLMRRLNAAGYATYCPMQAEFKKWAKSSREIITPLFSGCLFVKGDAVAISSVLTSQKAAFFVDADGNKISILADKASLSERFIQMFKG